MTRSLRCKYGRRVWDEVDDVPDELFGLPITEVYRRIGAMQSDDEYRDLTDDELLRYREMIACVESYFSRLREQIGELVVWSVIHQEADVYPVLVGAVQALPGCVRNTIHDWLCGKSLGMAIEEEAPPDTLAAQIRAGVVKEVLIRTYDPTLEPAQVLANLAAKPTPKAKRAPKAAAAKATKPKGGRPPKG